MNPTLRVLGHAWAAPVTALGLLQALLGGARFFGIGPDGMLLFVVTSRGLSGRFCRRFRVSAYTWGAVVTFAGPDGTRDERLVLHEREHLRQTFVLGPLMPLAYLLASGVVALKGGRPYGDNPFEVAARRAELRGPINQ